MRLLGRGSRVLVTGGAGFVGAAVTRRLLADGFVVRVLDDLSSGHRSRLEGLPVELVVGDIRAERSVRDACADVEAIMHLAAPQAGPARPRARDERHMHDVNVTGTLNLLAAAREAKVGRFLYASSATVYGGRSSFLLHEDVATHPSTADGAQKLCAESYVRLHGARDAMLTCILRLFTVYGADQDARGDDPPFMARFLASAASRQPLVIQGDGTQTRDLIHVDDAAAAFAHALQASGIAGKILNVASGEAVAVRHVASVLSELMGGLPAPRYAAAPLGEPQDVRASVAAASAALNFRARIRLREGLSGALERRAAIPSRRSDLEPAIAPLPAPLLSPPPLAPPPPRVVAEGSDARLFADRPPSWTLDDEPRPVKTPGPKPPRNVHR
jgi:UDP-glucose 4-epimerase